MDAKGKLNKLLSDEKFQNDIRDLLWQQQTKERKETILKDYSITEDELNNAKKFLSVFAFHHQKAGSYEINYALKRLITRIHDTSLIPLKNNRKQNLLSLISKIAAVLFLPLFLSTLYFYQKATSLSSEYEAREKVFNTFQAPPGAKTQLLLPDGTRVWLNSGSSLSYPSAFNAKSRNVKLKGEAYFEVVKNARKPMIVSTGHLKVEVYGTKFNVNAFADDGVIKTTLVEGKVTLISEDHKKYILTPGYSASYSIKQKKIQLTKVEEMDAYTGWREGKLLFHNIRFTAIIRELERWYNVDIQLTDKSLGNDVLYATFFDENIEQVLAILSKSIPISVEYPKRIKQPDGSYSKQKIIINRN